MGSFRSAFGAGDDWLRACDFCLAELGEPLPGASLGIVYVSSGLAHSLDLIATRLREATGIETWVGSSGKQVCALERDDQSDDGLSVLIAALPAESFRLFDGLDDVNAGHVTSFAARLAIIHGDPRQTRMPAMIARLAENTGAFLVGGLTSARQNDGMQIAGRPTEGGLSGVLLSADVPIVAGLTQGCSPIGPKRQITGMDGAWITALDDCPALDALKEDVGPLLARNWERLSGFILAARPEEGGDGRDYLVRDLGEADSLRGAIMVGDDLRKGDPLCFVKRDPDGARADLRRLIDDLKRRAEGRPIQAALYHSCIGRGRHLFGSDQAELAMIAEGLGSVPLAGFATNGEIFRDRLYGYSGVLTLFLGEALS